MPSRLPGTNSITMNASSGTLNGQGNVPAPNTHFVGVAAPGFRSLGIGGYPRGDLDHDRDIDLLVVCPVAGRKRDLMVAMDRALGGLGIARDVIVLTSEEYERDRHIPGAVARPASLEGRTLYDSTA